MNFADFKAEWVKRLRSGIITQATGVLEHFGCCCVMGVACQVYYKDKENSVVTRNKTVSYDGHTNSVPWELVDFVEQNSKLDVDKLVNLNDSGKCDFVELARIIEDESEIACREVG